MAARSTASWKRLVNCTLAVSRPRLTNTCAGMSRHEMMISEAMFSSAQARSGVCPARHSRSAGIQLEAHSPGDVAGLLFRLGSRVLGEIHQLAIVAEIFLCQLRMPVETETAGDETIVMAQQEVSQIERAGLGILQLRKRAAAGEKLVAVGAGQPLQAFLAQ